MIFKASMVVDIDYEWYKGGVQGFISQQVKILL